MRTRHAAMRLGWPLLLLAVALRAAAQLPSPAPAGVAADAASPAGGVPSWWECVRCGSCELRDADAPPPPRAAWGSRRHCAVCAGCTHRLEELPGNITLPDTPVPDQVVPIRYGSTGAALFLATDGSGRQEVLKLHGTAAASVSPAKFREQRGRYGTKRYLPQEAALAQVLTPLAESCGLRHVSTAERVARVRAVLPASGEQLAEAHAVLAERAHGVSLDILTLKLRPPALLARMQAVGHAAVRDAALYDLLFYQGDRHAENVLLGDDGAMKLIDSRDAALGDACNSCFLPGSFYFERTRVGVENMGDPSRPIVTHHWPQLLLDYRCHVPGGAIGTNYPPKFRECITEWAAMSASELYDARFAAAAGSGPAAGRDAAAGVLRRAAARLQAQAAALLSLGFEGALDAVVVANNTGRVPFPNGFAKPPPCCAMEASPPEEAQRGRPYQCAPGGHVTLPADYKYLNE